MKTSSRSHGSIVSRGGEDAPVKSEKAGSPSRSRSFPATVKMSSPIGGSSPSNIKILVGKRRDGKQIL